MVPIVVVPYYIYYYNTSSLVQLWPFVIKFCIVVDPLYVRVVRVEYY